MGSRVQIYKKISVRAPAHNPRKYQERKKGRRRGKMERKKEGKGKHRRESKGESKVKV